MEVGLNADTLHHQVLRHPGHKLLLHRLLQLFNLKKTNIVLKKASLTIKVLEIVMFCLFHFTFCVMFD